MPDILHFEKIHILLLKTWHTLQENIPYLACVNFIDHVTVAMRLCSLLIAYVLPFSRTVLRITHSLKAKVRAMLEAEIVYKSIVS